MAPILILAFLARLIGINQSLWLDEATSANVTRQLNFLEVIPKFSIGDFHPPLYYLFMDLWTSLFGYSEIALRLPSIIFSLLTGWTVYLIAKELKNEKAGIWAAVFFLFNPLIVYYSQEARMYMLVTFFLTLTLYFYLKKRYAFFNLFSFLSFLTFYGSIFFLSAIFIYSLFGQRLKEIPKLVTGLIFGLILVSPLLYQQWVNSRTALLTVQNWSLVLGQANLKNLLLIPVKFSIGRISFEPKALYWTIAGLWTIFVFWFVFKPVIRPKRHSGLFGFLFFTPLALGFIASFFSPLLQYFRFLYLVPIMALLIVAGTNRDWQKYTLITAFVIFSLIYLLIPGFHREDWKSLVNSLPVDRKIYMVLSSSDPIKYYNSQIEINDLKQITKTDEAEIVVIPYTSDIHGVDYKSVLEKNGYKIKETKSFRGVYFERWLKQAFYYSPKISPPFNQNLRPVFF